MIRCDLSALARALAVGLLLPVYGSHGEPRPSRIGMFVRDAEQPSSLPINYESHWYAQSGLALKYNRPDEYRKWLERLRKYPPEIYHGEVAPISWGIGPAEPRPGMPIDYYKFDKSAGHHWLTPEQWGDRVEKTREHLAEMRDAGVKEILCYTCFNSIGGNHVKRTGLWEFHDRWDSYKDMLGLPPRPPDPTEWLRVWGKHWGPNPKGNLPVALKPFSFAYGPRSGATRPATTRLAGWSGTRCSRDGRPARDTTASSGTTTSCVAARADGVRAASASTSRGSTRRGRSERSSKSMT